MTPIDLNRVAFWAQLAVGAPSCHSYLQMHKKVVAKDLVSPQSDEAHVARE